MTDAKARVPQDEKLVRASRSLSTQLLILTIIFVLIAEAVVLIPSVAKHRRDWLNARIEAAYLVGLALEGPDEGMIQEDVAEQLFATAEILGVTVNRGGARALILAPEIDAADPPVMLMVDLTNAHAPDLIISAWATMFSRGQNLVRVLGKPRYASGGSVDIIISQAALRRDLWVYARNVLGLSLIISTLTAAFVYWSLNRLIVKPVQRLTYNMTAFQDNPEARENILEPTDRVDEIGAAERSLSALEKSTQDLLNERRRLAALGSGISKISHDLRNILASAQLMSDRLANSDDPRVQKLSPRLIQALDRAITLSRDTLSYGRMTPDALKKEDTDLHALVDEVFEVASAPNVRFKNEAPAGFILNVDRNQLYRALFNLVRNAVEAMTADADDDGTSRPTPQRDLALVIAARKDSEHAVIEIADTGPGLPEDARHYLFEPFKGSLKPGGSGLGLAIASEIMRAHGGDLSLARSGSDGAVFAIRLPLTESD